MVFRITPPQDKEKVYIGGEGTIRSSAPEEKISKREAREMKKAGATDVTIINQETVAPEVQVVNPVQVTVGPQVTPMRSWGKTTTWRTVMEKLREEEIGDDDDIYPLKELKVASNGDLEIRGVAHEFQPWAKQQLLEKLLIPIHYGKKCPPELFAENANYWMEREREDKKYQIRLRGNKVRGVLSERYMPLDTLQLLEVVAKETKEGKVQIRTNDGTAFSAAIWFDSATFVVGKDLYKYGLHFQNSEVGLRRAQLSFQLERQVCTNGLTVAVGPGLMYSWRHVAKSDRMDEARTAIISSVEGLEEKIPLLVQGIEDAHTRGVDIEKVFALVGKKFMFSKKGLESLHEDYMEDEEETEWGVAQALTRHAQGLLPVYREQVEKFAGTVMFEGLKGAWSSSDEKELEESVEERSN